MNRITSPLQPGNTGQAVANLQAGLRFLIDQGCFDASDGAAALPSAPTRTAGWRFLWQARMARSGTSGKCGNGTNDYLD